MIDIQKVSKRYDGHLAVDCLSLNINKGHIFGLLGPNGAGKTTLVNMMCGILNMDQGCVMLGGHDITKQPIEAKKKLGMVPQDIALFESMSVIQNLNYFGELYGLNRKALKIAVKEALDLAQLHDHKHKKVKALSGGMKRRLNIACSTLHKPEILILDEPTVGIDPQSRNHIMDVVKTLNREHNMTVIYITHYMEEVEKLCNRLAIVDQGKLIIEGTKDFIISSLTHHIQYRVETLSVNQDQLKRLKGMPGIVRVEQNETEIDIVCEPSLKFTMLTGYLEACDLGVEAITRVKPDLEWAFLKLTGRALRDS